MIKTYIHLLVINEFFWPDLCASSAVLTDHLPRIRRLRPDWRISVLTGDRAWDRPEVRWPARETWNGIEIARVPRPAAGRSLWRRAAGFLGFHRGAARIGRGLNRPDAIMASTAPPLGGRLGLRLARHFDCPMIYKVLDLYPECATTLGVLREGSLAARRWQALDTDIMRRAAAVVPISRGIAERIARTRGIAPQRIRLIRDGFDPDRVRPIPPEQNRFRHEHGLDGKIVIQYAGNMGLSHPFDTILAAAAKLADDPRIVFQFIGAGPGRATLLAAQAHAGPRMQLLAYQPAERLAEVLCAADIALISQAAGMAELSLPYKLYGILAAARPAVFVGPASSEIASLFREFGCGEQVEQGDAPRLAGELRDLANHADRRATMGAAGRKLLEERFPSERSAVEWVNLIEDVVASA